MQRPQSNKERKIILEYGTITLYGAPFQGASFNNLLFSLGNHYACLATARHLYVSNESETR